ncbi:Threonine/homoserine/homoserine lactone efflux protein [Tistlia consotensis]|uniref:Threonine/homoserine/homoserine lactone efflux protein n=1 Tax=Tistlia consotensis USBA 355 TaxID=560819 RepID=A0A1Y6CKC1_9PROT|nr:LysE family transporter [Tistlia consotensis]SMF60384.1 Threonine/homoserine/homoserine lactone efflux protein [Tistlia consotensis USBA 355]SNR93452.1 Threonine/homoserine/homoserine lactone efflux protein [Tistlia consotensis]
MQPDSILPLALFAAVATLSPGGATTLATASGARFGFRRSLPLLAGIALGLASLAATAALGLAGLLLEVPSLGLATRLAGSAYLLWLAWRLATSGAPGEATGTAAPVSFGGGLLLLLSNPKGWAMALAAAGSFASLADGPLQLALLLGAAFGLAAAASLTLWCGAGLLLGRWLRTEARWRVANLLLAALLAASIVPIWAGV